MTPHKKKILTENGAIPLFPFDAQKNIWLIKTDLRIFDIVHVHERYGIKDFVVRWRVGATEPHYFSCVVCHRRWEDLVTLSQIQKAEEFLRIFMDL